MINIENSKEFLEIVNYLNKKDYKKALNKIKLISSKYPNNNIIFKFFANIYFSLKNWENAIIYYKKLLNFENKKYGIYTNIGVAFFKLGKINESINFFKKAINENPNFDLAYDNLGISYLEIGKFEEAIQNFVSALKLNEENINSQNNLINTLSLSKPKDINKHILTNLDNKIKKIETEYKFKNFLDEKRIKKILEKSNQLISNLKKNIYFNETQIFRKNSKNLNCKRHFKVFNKFNVIPKYCFSCYKIQINLYNVVDLIKLSFIFDNLYLTNNNTRKCIVEIRDQIKGNYKGYIYCEGLADAKIVKEKIDNKLLKANLKNHNINIKHGCSEFYQTYPKFEKINYQGKQEFEYNEDWEYKEKLIDNNEPKRINADKKIWQESLKGLNLSDILIINNWLNYADTIGDFSYKKIYDKKLMNTSSIKDILIKQLKFRKNNLKNYN